MTSGHYCWFRAEFFITGLQDIHCWHGQTATLTEQVGHGTLWIIRPHSRSHGFKWLALKVMCASHVRITFIYANCNPPLVEYKAYPHNIEENKHRYFLLVLTFNVRTYKIRRVRGNDPLYCSLSYPTVIFTLLWYIYPIPTSKVMMTQLQQFKCFIRSGGNATPKHVCPVTEGGNPTIDLPCSGL